MLNRILLLSSRTLKEPLYYYSYICFLLFLIHYYHLRQRKTKRKLVCKFLNNNNNNKKIEPQHIHVKAYLDMFKLLHPCTFRAIFEGVPQHVCGRTLVSIKTDDLYTFFW